MATFSCKGCEDRYPACHGSCERYLKEREEYDRRKAAIDKQKRISFGIQDQVIRAIEKEKRKRHRSPYKIKR